MTKLNIRDAIKIERQKLSNGLDIVIIPMNRVPLVSLNLEYKVGSADEVRGKSGFAHLFEHLMFEGTEKLAKGEFDRYCSIAGGTNNAYTTYDNTTYIMTLPSNQLELGLWLESDRMFGSKVVEHALKNQQNVVTEEIRQTVENSPYGRWRELLATAAFDKKTAYSWEVHGSIEDVQNCTLQDADAFHKKFYRPENAVMVIAGDVDPDKAFKMTEKYFETKTTPSGIITNEFKSDYKLYGNHASYEDTVPLNASFLSYHIPGFMEDDIFTADVLAYIIGDGRSARLYKNLVHEQHIASSIGAFVDKRQHASLFTIYAIAVDESVSADKLDEALKTEIKKILDNGVEDIELEKAKNQLTTAAAYEMQYSQGLADIVGNHVTFWDDPEMIYTVLDKYYEVDKAKIADFAQRFLLNDKSIRVDVLPKG